MPRLRERLLQLRRRQWLRVHTPVRGQRLRLRSKRRRLVRRHEQVLQHEHQHMHGVSVRHSELQPHGRELRVQQRLQRIGLHAATV